MVLSWQPSSQVLFALTAAFDGDNVDSFHIVNRLTAVTTTVTIRTFSWRGVGCVPSRPGDPFAGN